MKRGKQGRKFFTRIPKMTAILKKSAALCKELRSVLFQLGVLLLWVLEVWHHVKDQQIPRS